MNAFCLTRSALLHRLVTGDLAGAFANVTAPDLFDPSDGEGPQAESEESTKRRKREGDRPLDKYPHATLPPMDISRSDRAAYYYSEPEPAPLVG